MNKKALLVGCNYPGTQAALRGCVNDVWSMRDLLIQVKGFDASNIRVMIDTDPRYEKPTGANIKRALTDLIQRSRSGDILVFHYSGHGTQVPAEGQDHETDYKDEALAPTDLNLITDDDLRHIVERLPHNVDLTFVADCCHSGGMLDHRALQITGGSSPPGLNLMDVMGSLLGSRGLGGLQIRSRELPIGLLCQMLSQRSGTRVAPGNIRYTLGNMFGRDASSMAVSFMHAVQAAGGLQALAGGGGGGSGHRNGNGGGQILMLLCQCLMSFLHPSQQQQQGQQNSGGGGAYGGGQQYGGGTPQGPYGSSGPGYSQGGQSYGGGNSGGNTFSAPPAQYPSGFNPPPVGKPPAGQQLQEEKGILVSGCQSHETSADACPSGDPSKAFGALTNGIVTLARRDPNITFYSLVDQVRGYLKTGGFKQNPGLECTSGNAQKKFIC